MSVYAGPEITTNGLVLHLDAANAKSYPGSGTTWTDLSGNGNNGALTNGPTFSGGSIVFDGVDDYVDCGTNLIPASNSPRTMQLWVKIGTSGNAAYRALLNQGTYGSDQMIQIGINGGQFNVNNYSATWTDSVSYTTNLWYLLTVSYNGSSFTFYKNGIFIRSDNITLNTVMGKMRVGSNPDGGENVNASVAQVSIYNRALTAAEISQNFNALRGRFGI